ncbi:MAG: hypothetical protein ACI31M_02830 [Bacilli bacterium]
MKHYDMNKLINESGFKNYNEIANYLLNEFHRTEDCAEKLEIMQFAKSNNIDVLGLVTGEKTVEFYNQPTMTTEEIKENIEEIAKPVDVAPPVDDKVKQVLD